MKFLQETTVWEDNTPNHIYMFEYGMCVGYIKKGTTEQIMFKVPSKQFNKRYRTFKEVKV